MDLYKINMYEGEFIIKLPTPWKTKKAVVSYTIASDPSSIKSLMACVKKLTITLLH